MEAWSDNVSEVHRVHVIACGVLALDIADVARRLKLDISSEYLEGGLHETPAELRRRLQEAVDRASTSGQCDLIAIGYGICGRGTVGLRSSAVPLAIPRAHDCIALFLGSDAAYRREFAKYPGTYYISAGWFKEKVQPLAKRKGAGKAPRSAQADIERLSEKYGPENAQAIVDFLNSWRKNYQRAAVIDTGRAAGKKYVEHAKAMAEEFGWKFEQIQGDVSLLEKMLNAKASSDEILVVPPHHVTVYDAMLGGLKAAPVWQQAQKQPRRHARALPHAAGPAAVQSTPEMHIQIGLGIDAGGTYTDVVLFDFPNSKVLAKGKALTTKWDFTIGIGNALSLLPQDLLKQAALAAVSTTLATNAIVEGHGQKVGLLVMPPYGLFDPADIEHEPKAPIKGRLDINGLELEPIDPAQVVATAKQMISGGVGAFAVTGFAGAVNPRHELEVKAVLKKEFGLSVTCGHELSELLNFQTRGQTAVLNARIIPRLEKFLRHVEQTLSTRGLHAPIMVVKGDGSLMSAKVARERPVETILSGPAASVAGARYLTNIQTAIVVDVGGTTTDTAALDQGAVRTCPDGTRVGGFKTHVKALDMRTVGLGGDSLLGLDHQVLRIGPRRVSPVSYLATTGAAGIGRAFDYIESRLDDFAASTEPMEMVYATGFADHIDLSKEEKSLLRTVAERPHSLAELAQRTGREHYSLLRLGRLEENHILQRSALTPTDLLHVRGQFVRWDAAAGERLCRMFAQIAGMERDEFIDDVFHRMVRRLAIEVIKKRLDDETTPDAMDDCPACGAVLNNLLGGGGKTYSVKMQLHCPIIGIGAPVHFFLPQAAALLGTQAIVPANADVANAVGAITSNVMVQHSVVVCPNQAGGYMVEGAASAGQFLKFEDAHHFAEEHLRKLVRHVARSAGSSETEVKMHSQDRIATSADGAEIFLGRVITASLSGRPDLTVVRSEAHA